MAGNGPTTSLTDHAGSAARDATRCCDILVLGSGFAGSLISSILQRQGRDVLLVDRAVHPRFAIGESSTPIANMVLRELARRYALPELLPLAKYGSWKQAYPHIGCGLKRGFSYFPHSPGEPFRPAVDHANELLVAASSHDEQSDTQWLRADVDAFLVELARSRGVEVWEGAAVRRIEWIADSPPVTNGPSSAGTWRIDIEHAGGTRPTRARFAIDATGEAAILARAAGSVNQPERLHTNSRAIFTHVWGLADWQEMARERGARIEDYPFCCDDAAQHHLLDGAWMWQLRFDQGLTSVGFTLDGRRYPLEESCSPETEWEQWLARYPDLRREFHHTRIAEPPGKILRSGRLQRRLSLAAGPGWAALPHTAGFIDPLHSTGIAHSLCGIERLAGILGETWGHASLTEKLKNYEASLFAEIELIDRLVSGCYRTLHQFPAFVAMTMLYFATVVTHERRRSQSVAENGWFLNAHDPEIQRLVATAEQLAGNLPPEAFVAHVRAAIAPYNRVGLFSPAIPNMYRHTVAPA